MNTTIAMSNNPVKYLSTVINSQTYNNLPTVTEQCILKKQPATKFSNSAYRPMIASLNQYISTFMIKKNDTSEKHFKNTF